MISYNDLKDIMEIDDYPVVIYDIQNDGYYVDFFNKAGEELEGITFEEVKGKRIDHIRPTISETDLFNVFKRVYETGQSEEYTAIYELNNTIVKRKNFVKKLSNKKIFVRYYEYTVKEILNKHINNLDNSPIGIFIINNKGEFIYGNKVFLSLIGKKKIEEVHGSEIFEKNITDYVDQMDKKIKMEKTIKSTNKDVIVSLLRLDENEIIGYCVDITEIKEYGKKMKKAYSELEESKRKIEKSDNLKSSFLANISHEIRTPLNSIVGFARLLLKVGRADRRKYVSIIEKNSDMLLHLIDDIIDLSKMESKEVRLRTDRCSLLSIVEDIKMSHIDKTKEGVSLELDNDLSNVVIYTDESRLKQVLNNLVGNAIKFTDNGYIRIGYCVKERDILFRIEDTGIGIPKEESDYIFERFTQLDEKDSRKYGGTGLGLPISKKIVELLGGKIWFESKVGKGTTFFFTIPSDYVHKITNEYNNIQKYAKRKINWKGKNILIVEDEEYSSMLLTKLLGDTNCSYTIVSYGIDALKILEKDDFDLVLSDVKLPDINGEDLVKRIKKKKKDIPVIAQSAYVYMKDDVIDSGFDDYLVKPIEVHKLIKTLNKYLK
jgi:signal transduction histidine kinase/CheY-like chemotaxis protein